MIGKRLVFMFILAVSVNFLNSFGQEIKISDLTKKYQTENVVKLDSLPKVVLQEKCINWLGVNYTDSVKKNYIKNEPDKIVTHQIFNPDPDNLWGYTGLRIGFTLTLDFKNGKLKYLFTDFYYSSLGDGKVLFESSKFKNYDIILRNRMLQETNRYIGNSVIEMISYINDIGNKSDW